MPRNNGKNKFACLTAVAALGWLLILLPPAKIAAQTALPPGVSIQLEAAPLKATVGDAIQIDLDIATPPGYRAEIPVPPSQHGDFSILRFSRGPTTAEPNASLLHHKAQIAAAVYSTGSFTFPPVQIMLEDNEGRKTMISSPSVKIEIQSVIGKDVNLRDLKKQADIPEKFRWMQWLLLALAGCILALIGRRLWKRKREKSSAGPAATPARDPLDAYESELRDLLARGLPAEGHEKKFYILLSNIVKSILESGFGISAAEQTTSEIMDSMRQVRGLSGEKLEIIEAFFARCDVIKFAKYLPSKPEHATAGENALRILDVARANRKSEAGGSQPV